MEAEEPQYDCFPNSTRTDVHCMTKCWGTFTATYMNAGHFLDMGLRQTAMIDVVICVKKMLCREKKLLIQAHEPFLMTFQLLNPEAQITSELLNPYHFQLVQSLQPDHNRDMWNSPVGYLKKC